MKYLVDFIFLETGLRSQLHGMKTFDMNVI